jgi:hypothetical protein
LETVRVHYAKVGSFEMISITDGALKRRWLGEEVDVRSVMVLG